VIRTRESWPPKRDDLIAAARKARAEMNPPSKDEEHRELPDREGISSQAILPDAFDHLTGHPRRFGGYRRLAGVAALAVVALAVGFLLLKPRLQSGESSPPVYRPPEAYPGAPPGAETPPPVTNPIGRLVVITELPDNAWLEIDGKVYASGLGIDFPLRVAGDTTHRIAVNARGYKSWQSEVSVPRDSLVRLEVTLERLSTAQAPRRTTRRSEPRRPEPEPVVPSRVVDTRPPMPTALRDSLILRLEEGRVFHEIGRYFDAASEYRYVLDRVSGATVAYRSSSLLEMLRVRADSALQAVRLDCRAAGETDCP